MYAHTEKLITTQFGDVTIIEDTSNDDAFGMTSITIFSAYNFAHVGIGYTEAEALEHLFMHIKQDLE